MSSEPIRPPKSSTTQRSMGRPQSSTSLSCVRCDVRQTRFLRFPSPGRLASSRKQWPSEGALDGLPLLRAALMARTGAPFFFPWSVEATMCSEGVKSSQVKHTIGTCGDGTGTLHLAEYHAQRRHYPRFGEDGFVRYQSSLADLALQHTCAAECASRS